jgi:hypothetical protein
MKTNFVPMSEIAPLIVRAGFTGVDAITALAVCWAESGGNTLAVNINVANPLSPSFRSMDLGLCQFNTYWNPKFPIADMFDPGKSVERMWQLHSHYGFRLWTVFHTGTYQRWIDSARNSLNAGGFLS